MRSDIVKLSGTKADTLEALKEAEGVAGYFQLPRKEAIRLRLLAEELMGMVTALTGTRTAEFWIENDEEKEQDVLRLHLKTETNMNTELRKSLLSASTSGKNAAAQGFSGKLRDLFARAVEPEDKYVAEYYAAGWVYNEAEGPDFGVATANVWSFNRYRDSLPAEEKESRDELEKSIIANLADEVKVSIKGGSVEMIVYKKINA